MNDSSAKTSSTAAKIKQAADIATFNNELKHINKALERLESRPPRPHNCSQEDRIDVAEQELAGIRSRWKVSQVIQGIVASLVVALAVLGLQFCSANDSAIAEARTVNSAQSKDIDDLEKGISDIQETQRTESARVLESIGELRGEVRALSESVKQQQQQSERGHRRSR